MKIAVVGIGVAGAHSMNRLSDDQSNQVVGFERMPKDEHDAVCLGNMSKRDGRPHRKCGLNFDDYVLHNGRHMQVDLEGNGALTSSFQREW